MPGVSYERYLRESLALGEIPQAQGQEEVWLARRLAQHRAPEGPIEQLRGSSWLLVKEQRTPEGGCLIIVTDITALKRREEELRQARDDLDRANRAKNAFLANMSHELRTPLNAILGFADIIRQRLFSDDIDRYAAYAGDIHASGALLLALINDMLDLARIEAGALRLAEEPVDLGETAAAAAQIVRSSARSRPDGAIARLGLRLAPDLPPLLGDRRALLQILINLLSNAARHTPAEGRITLAIDRGADGDLVIVVDDDGPGIAPTELPHLFEPFRRRDPTTRGAAEGTGLGLPIVKRLVDMHGGAIAITSGPRPDRASGTTVTITLPAARLADPTRPATPA